MNRRKFRIPDEGDQQEVSARRYVQRAWPEASPTQIDGLFERGEVEADKILVTRPESPLAADTTVEVDIEQAGRRSYGVPEVEAILRGDRWTVVDKPVGIPGRISEDDPTDPIRFMADVLGIDRADVAPAWEMPTRATGPWVLAHDAETARRLATDVVRGTIQTTWQAVIRRPERPHGRWDVDGGFVDYAITKTRGALAEVQLHPEWKSIDEPRRLVVELLEMLAEAGSPVLGDAVRHGYLVAGDLRLRLGAMYGTEEFATSWPSPRDWWPGEVVIAPVEVQSRAAESDAGMGRSIGQLNVPARIVESLEQRGHPWVMRDPGIAVDDGLRAGTLMEVVGPDGPTSTIVIVDGRGPVLARLWSDTREQGEHFEQELSIRIDEAIGRRRARFQAMAETDVFRLVHGEADGLPGVVVDQMGNVIRVAIVSDCARGYVDTLYELLSKRDPEATIVELDAVDASAGPGQSPSLRVVERNGLVGEFSPEVVARERGLRYVLDRREPFQRQWTIDQRANRRLAAERAQSGQRWLVVEGDGGSFSIALAAAGADVTAISAGRKRLATNLELNDLSTDAIDIVDANPMDWWSDGDCDFDGVVVDISVDAITGTEDEFFRRCVDAVVAGGWLLFSRRPSALGESVEAMAERIVDDDEVSVESMEVAGPAEDFPSLEGFTEGEPFEAVWIRR